MLGFIVMLVLVALIVGFFFKEVPFDDAEEGIQIELASYFSSFAVFSSDFFSWILGKPSREVR